MGLSKGRRFVAWAHAGGLPARHTEPLSSRGDARIMKAMRTPPGATLLAIVIVPIGIASLWASHRPARVADFTPRLVAGDGWSCRLADADGTELLRARLEPA